MKDIRILVGHVTRWKNESLLVYQTTFRPRLGLDQNVILKGPSGTGVFPGVGFRLCLTANIRR